MTNPKCIVCGKPIGKKTRTVYFRPPREAQPAFNAGPMGGYVPPFEARPDGHREIDDYSTTIYLAKLPATKAEAARYVNGTIVSVDNGPPGQIASVGVWDGVSYRDKYFHSQTCAARQGYASARQGDRYVWKDN